MLEIPSTREDVIDAIVEFCEENPSAEWHFGHVVLSDYNLEDHYIENALETCFTEEHIQESRAIHYHPISDDEITRCAAFLKWLLTIPEDVRCESDEYNDVWNS